AVASLVFPDQIIDCTHGRQHTFFGSEHGQVTHIDFSEPYCEELRQILIVAAKRANLAAAERGTYAATQGPRFETAAEIRHLEHDGADVVGMTGMPEAGLARELGLCYACIAVVANPAAGKAKGKINLKEIEKNLDVGMTKVRALLEQAIPMIVEA
ncbi:MAG: S-methyl-5'-thioadenosine phosphorylase, partial [Acidiferrobacterales bacterium]